MSASIELKGSNVVSVHRSRGDGILELFQGWLHRRRTHHYHGADMGQNFVLDADADSSRAFYMTSQKMGVRADDYIEIHGSSGSMAYRVQEVDYYSDQPDMWTARLILLADS